MYTAEANKLRKTVDFFVNVNTQASPSRIPNQTLNGPCV